MAGFAACRALSTDFNDTPEKASRPYDRDRDGFVHGRRRGRGDAGRIRTRQGARREDLRRGQGLRYVGRRLSHHGACPRDGEGGYRSHDDGAETRRHVRPPTSTTSTRTAPRRRWATRSNCAPSSDCSATPPARCRCRRPSRRSGICWARRARWRRSSPPSPSAIRWRPPPSTSTTPRSKRDRPGAAHAEKAPHQRRAFQLFRFRRHQCDAGPDGRAVARAASERMRKKAQCGSSRFSFCCGCSAAAVAAAAWWEDDEFLGRGPARTETIVVDQAGQRAGRRSRRQLEEARRRSTARMLFRLGVMRRKAAAALKAGEYAFPAHASMADVLDMLMRSTSHRAQDHDRRGADQCDGGRAGQRRSGADGAPSRLRAAEGSLLPETYLFERGTTRDRNAGAHAQGADRSVRAAVAQAQAGLPYKHRRGALTWLRSWKRKRACRPNARALPRVPEPAAQGHEARIRSDDYLWPDQGRAAGPSDLGSASSPGPIPTAPIRSRACRRGPSAIRGKRRDCSRAGSARRRDLFFVANGTGGHVVFGDASGAREERRRIGASSANDAAATHTGRASLFDVARHSPA